jgi:hypothetical protein
MRSATMPKPNSDEVLPSELPTRSTRKRGRPEEPMDDEEKVLAGRPDVNMPALLTKDVPGG